MAFKSLLFRLVACICCIAFTVFCVGRHKQPTNNFLPQDLMYNGSPIHPSCVVATQFGDSSRLEPQLVTHTRVCGKDNHTLSCDPTTKTVTATWEYSIVDCDDSYCCSESYHYIGSYKNKHIVITRHYDTSGTGRFAELGLVTRNGDTICNAGEIAGGDRAHGGIIEIISFTDNIVRFRQIATPDHPGLWLVHQVDLDDPELTTIFCGISFLDKESYRDCAVADVVNFDINFLPNNLIFPHIPG